MNDMLVVVSKVKSFVKSIAGDDFRIGGDYLDEISKAVEELTKSAVARAKTAGRKTLKAEDL